MRRSSSFGLDLREVLKELECLDSMEVQRPKMTEHLWKVDAKNLELEDQRAEVVAQIHVQMVLTKSHHLRLLHRPSSHF